MNRGALSPAEIEALLAGTPAASRPHALETSPELPAALVERFAAWLPKIQFLPIDYPHFDPAACEARAVNADCTVFCDRALAASLVDYCYGGDGMVEFDERSPWSVSERHMATRVLEYAEAAWNALAEPRERCAFEVRIAGGRGMLIFEARSHIEETTAIELVALAGYLHLDAATAATLNAGDLIAFEPLRPMLLLGGADAMTCRFGSRGDHYAVCVEEQRAEPQPSIPGRGEFILSIELGRVVVSTADYATLDSGVTLVLDQPLAAPLRAMHNDTCFALVEIVEVANGFAIHILERT